MIKRAGAEQLRQIVQNAIAAGETNDPFLRAYLVDKLDVTVDRYPSGYLAQNIYVLHFQGELRREQFGPGLDTVTIQSSLTGGGAWLTTRMDGIQYYGVEDLNIGTGSGTDVLDVQGTTKGSNDFAGTAATTVTLDPHDLSRPNGDDRAYLSSNADLDGLGNNYWRTFDFLTGNLDDFRGALNVDLGNGRHRLFMSDEASSHADDYAITDSIGDSHNKSTAGLLSGADIYVTRAGLPGISYKTSGAGNLFDGVIYWTGSGNDTVFIDGTQNRAGQRTTTILNTGLGNDTITATLDAATDGFFVLETSGGSATGDPIAHALPAVQDNDKVFAQGSTLPLVIIGGFGDDEIHGGQGNDIILGDAGIVQYVGAGEQLAAQFGFGGRGDVIDALRPLSPIVDPRWVYTYTPDMTLGGSDTIYGNNGEDILIGGAYGDRIDGGTMDDLIFGDAVQLFRRDTTIGAFPAAAIYDPRFEGVTGPMYALGDATGTQVDNANHVYRDPFGGHVPDWAEYVIGNLYHDYARQASNDHSFGNDYIAGGAANDVIFGQLGNDTIQGDGSIDYAAPGCSSVGATWSASDSLVTICASRDNIGAAADDTGLLAVDGNDYIEGNGGNDIIFGNQGQDDIVGGSSSLYTLTNRLQRPDGSDLLFGGSGTNSGRNDLGASTQTGGANGQIATNANGHAHDADVLVGDNGNIFRLVSRPGVADNSTGFLAYNYDLNAYAVDASAPEHVIPRAVALLDYTPGGFDYNAAAAASDIGAADLIHGESGDDVIYGMVGNDALYGDAQNDTIIGGYGADWISGGLGDDGILGDDGRLFVSRNSATYGEPLYGIGTVAVDVAISTPGNMQQAVTNPNGVLKYAADLTPDNLKPGSGATTSPDELFVPLYANDIIFGGLGNDWIHGGAGDDAVSGAEAEPLSYTALYNASLTPTGIRESDYTHPYNSGNSLGYSATNTYQAQYDPNHPFAKILLTSLGALGGTNDWFLNFSSTEGPTDTFWAAAGSQVPTDGNDHIFGDLGNDWLVGGTGRDTLWGGWANDLIARLS